MKKGRGVVSLVLSGARDLFPRPKWRGQLFVNG